MSNGLKDEIKLKFLDPPSPLIIITNPNEQVLTFIENFLGFLNFPLNPIFSKGSLNIYKNNNEHSIFPYVCHIFSQDYLNEYSIILSKYFKEQTSFIICYYIDENFNKNHINILNLFLSNLNHLTPIIFFTNSESIYKEQFTLKNINLDLFKFKNYKDFLSFVIKKLNNKKHNLQNNFLNKKRNAIFHIEKIPKYSNQSYAKYNQNYKAFQLDGSKNDNGGLNYTIEHDNLARNSLISISKEVFRFIKHTGKTKGAEVTSHILEILSSKGNKLNYKNIQRRVYDAINVMSAIGVIQKDKGNITYLKKDSNIPNYNNSSNDFSNNNSNKGLIEDEEIEQLNYIKKAKQNLLVQQCSQNFFYSKFINMNQTDIKRNCSLDRLNFPFYIITLNNKSEFKIKQADCNNKVVILSDYPFQIIEPNYIIKYFASKELNNENIKKYFKSDLANYLIQNNLIQAYQKSIIPNLEEFKGLEQIPSNISLELKDNEKNENKNNRIIIREANDDEDFKMFKSEELLEFKDNQEKILYFSP